MTGEDRINLFVQQESARRGISSVTAVEAANGLDRAGILQDSRKRPGRPLRNLLRAGAIRSSRQEPNQRHGKWFIDKEAT